MKKDFLVLTALTLSSIATLAVQAQPDANGPPPVGPGTGGDDAKRQEHRQRMLQKFDANHDGQLDDNEKAQMRAEMQKRWQQRQGVAPGLGDSNGINAQRGQGLDQHGPGGGFNDQERQEHRQRMLQKFDANHDGKLDDNEKAQMHEFMQRRRQEREQGGGGFSGPGGGAAPGGNPTAPNGGAPSGGNHDVSGGDVGVSPRF